MILWLSCCDSALVEPSIGKERAKQVEMEQQSIHEESGGGWRKVEMGHWWGAVRCVIFRAVGWVKQERRLVCRKRAPLIQRFSSGKDGGRERGEPANPGSPGRWLLLVVVGHREEYPELSAYKKISARNVWRFVWSYLEGCILTKVSTGSKLAKQKPVVLIMINVSIWRMSGCRSCWWTADA